MDGLTPLDDGFHVTTVDASEKGIALQKFDERTYDHILLFCPRTNGSFRICGAKQT